MPKTLAGSTCREAGVEVWIEARGCRVEVCCFEMLDALFHRCCFACKRSVIRRRALVLVRIPIITAPAKIIVVIIAQTSGRVGGLPWLISHRSRFKSRSANLTRVSSSTKFEHEVVAVTQLLAPHDF